MNQPSWKAYGKTMSSPTPSSIIPEPPTFDNTISFSVPDNLLGRVGNVFFNLLSAETNDDMDALAQKMSPILTEHANNVLLNEKLFARVKAVYESHRELTPEEQMLLEKKLRWLHPQRS